jgi:hypothetical protein
MSILRSNYVSDMLFGLVYYRLALLCHHTMDRQNWHRSMEHIIAASADKTFLQCESDKVLCSRTCL